MATTGTTWDPKQRMIITRISGAADSDDVTRWEQSLLAALEAVPDNGVFKIMVDLHGFKAVNFDVHKQFRVIIPKTLADYDWRVGYLDMFPESQIELKRTRGIRCVAAVHVHQDESKIRNYDEHYSRNNERFFTDPAMALDWINAFAIPGEPVHSR